MDLKDFLEKVLPATGTSYFSASVTPDGQLRQNKHQDITTLALQLAAYNKQRRDVYFATGTYKDKRQIASVELKKCLYVDLDVGTESHKYPSKKEAMVQLAAFCSDFPSPNLIVDSGGGIHAYWSFAAPVPLGKWQPVANALKQRCVDKGLKADLGITSDAARILRVPGSINYKHGTGKQTQVLRVKDDYDFEDLRQALSVGTVPSLGIVANDDDLSGGVIAKADHKWEAKYIVEKCPMFKDAMTTGGANISERLWSQQVYVLAYCEDGDDYVHEISKGYAGYAQAETQMKWNQKKAARDKEGSGPTKCDTFAEMSEHCEGCPFRGTVTSPLHLGVDRDHMMPRGYQQDARGVYYMSVETDELGNAQHVRTDVVNFQIKEFGVVHEHDSPAIARFNAVVKGKTLKVEIELGNDLHDKARCINVLATVPLFLDRFEFERFKDLMVSWAKAIQDAKNIQTVSSSLGWADNPKRFALANEVIYADGSRKPNVSAKNKALASIFTPMGSKEPWLELAKCVSQQNRHAANAAILTAFASPLLHFLRDSSVILSFVSAASGSGKTTALQIAQAVWGSPREAMNQLDDTQNAMFSRLGYINSLPAYWDEVRVKEDPARFMRMMFQLTGGREKQRLDSAANAKEVRKWETIFTIASNESIADHSKAADPGSEAGRVRVFEIEMPSLEGGVMVDGKIAGLTHQLFTNYGHVGAEYAEFLVRNHKVLAALVSSTCQKMTEKHMRSASERFWIVTVTVLLVAAKLAKKLGYLDIDLKSFEEWLMEELQKQRGDTGDSYGTREQVSGNAAVDFLSYHRSQIIVTEATSDGGRRVIQSVDRGEIVGSLSPKENLLRVNKRVFNEWVRDLYKMAPSAIVAGLSAEERRAPIDLSPGSPRVRVYDIWLDDEQLEGKA